MKKYTFLLLLMPAFLIAQESLPDYPNGTGFPLEYLHPEYGTGDSAILWLPGEAFFGEKGFRDIFYVTRENENHGGGMHQSWNITRLVWAEEGFLQAEEEIGLSHEWSVHYDTTYWDADAFVAALPDLEEPRNVNGEFYAFDKNNFLSAWGFGGYGSGEQYFIRSYAREEGYYVYAYSTSKYQEEEELLRNYWFLSPEGLPLKKVGVDEAGKPFTREYRYTTEGDFIGFKGEIPFEEKLKRQTADLYTSSYQLYANEKHFGDVVEEKFGYHPAHILVGFWRFGYVHFMFSPKEKKYILSEIVPFY